MNSSIDVGGFRLSVNKALLTEIESDVGKSNARCLKGIQYGLLDLMIQNIDNASKRPARFHMRYFVHGGQPFSFIYGENNRNSSSLKHLVESHKVAALLNVNISEDQTVVACLNGGYKGMDGKNVTSFGSGCRVNFHGRDTIICQSSTNAHKGDKLHLLYAFVFDGHSHEFGKLKLMPRSYKEPYIIIRVNKKEMIVHFNSIMYVNGETALGMTNEIEECADCAKYGINYELISDDVDYCTMLSDNKM